MTEILATLAFVGVLTAFLGLAVHAYSSLEKTLRAAGARDFTPTEPPEATFQPMLVIIGRLQFENHFTVQLFSQGVALTVDGKLLLIPYTSFKPSSSRWFILELSEKKILCSFGSDVDKLIAAKL